jgi:membrane protein
LTKQKGTWRVVLAYWKPVLSRVYDKFNDERLLAIAGGVVFYGLLALVPALATLVALYGFFADPSTVAGHLALVQNVMPAAAYGIVHDQVSRAASIGKTQLGLASLGGLLFALWSANSGTKAIMDALNVVYGEREKRGFMRYNLVSLALTLGTIVALVLIITAVVAVPLVLAAVGIDSISGLAILRWPLLLALVLAGLAVLYRFGPSRKDHPWRAMSAGIITAAVAWLASSALLSWYLANVANYNAIYGSLGAVIGLMLWMWISMIVILLGAELDAEIERAGKPEA